MNNTPAVRFKGFTEDWEQCKLGDIAPLRGGFAFKSQEYSDVGIPIVRISNILSDGTVGSAFVYYPEQIDDSIFSLKDGAALLAMSGATTGKVSILHTVNTDKYYQNQRVGYFTQTDKCDYEFLSTVVRSKLFVDQLNEVLAAGAQPNISSKDIDNFIFKISKSNDEQKMVGFVFSKLDNLIILHQHKYEKLINIKKSMLYKMFPQNGSKVPEIRFKGFTEDWKQQGLGELVQFSKGTGYSKSDLKETGTPIILYGRLYTKYETVIENVDTFADEKSGSVYSCGGEVIVPASGETAEDIAIASVVKSSGVLLGGDLNVIYPPKFIDSAFLAISISNGKPHSDMTKMAQGKTVVHLHNTDLEKIILLYPNYEEQIAIRNYFNTLDKLITLTNNKLVKLKQIKQAMLHKMFV